MLFSWDILLVSLFVFGKANALRHRDVDSGAAEPFFFKGHDLSSLKYLEDTGTSYKDTARGNQTRLAEDILGDGGMNSVRLR
jgi:arabinogalactan endo-1,4-beta-galactosidase